jgi:ribose transport system substrate-binding protein
MAQDPYTIGAAGIDQIARYLAGQTIPTSTYAPPVFFTKQNYKEAAKQLGVDLN